MTDTGHREGGREIETTNYSARHWPKTTKIYCQTFQSLYSIVILISGKVYTEI